MTTKSKKINGKFDWEYERDVGMSMHKPIKARYSLFVDTVKSSTMPYSAFSKRMEQMQVLDKLSETLIHEQKRVQKLYLKNKKTDQYCFSDAIDQLKEIKLISKEIFSPERNSEFLEKTFVPESRPWVIKIVSSLDFDKKITKKKVDNLREFCYETYSEEFYNEKIKSILAEALQKYLEKLEKTMTYHLNAERISASSIENRLMKKVANILYQVEFFKLDPSFEVATKKTLKARLLDRLFRLGPLGKVVLLGLIWGQNQWIEFDIELLTNQRLIENLKVALEKSLSEGPQVKEDWTRLLNEFLRIAKEFSVLEYAEQLLKTGCVENDQLNAIFSSADTTQKQEYFKYVKIWRQAFFLNFLVNDKAQPYHNVGDITWGLDAEQWTHVTESLVEDGDQMLQKVLNYFKSYHSDQEQKDRQEGLEAAVSFLDRLYLYSPVQEEGQEEDTDLSEYAPNYDIFSLGTSIRWSEPMTTLLERNAKGLAPWFVKNLEEFKSKFRLKWVIELFKPLHKDHPELKFEAIKLPDGVIKQRLSAKVKIEDGVAIDSNNHLSRHLTLETDQPPEEGQSNQTTIQQSYFEEDRQLSNPKNSQLIFQKTQSKNKNYYYQPLDPRFGVLHFKVNDYGASILESSRKTTGKQRWSIDLSTITRYERPNETGIHDFGSIIKGAYLLEIKDRGRSQKDLIGIVDVVYRTRGDIKLYSVKIFNVRSMRIVKTVSLNFLSYFITEPNNLNFCLQKDLMCHLVLSRIDQNGYTNIIDLLSPTLRAVNRFSSAMDSHFEATSGERHIKSKTVKQRSFWGSHCSVVTSEKLANIPQIDLENPLKPFIEELISYKDYLQVFRLSDGEEKTWINVYDMESKLYLGLQILDHTLIHQNYVLALFDSGLFLLKGIQTGDEDFWIFEAPSLEFVGGQGSRLVEWRSKIDVETMQLYFSAKTQSKEDMNSVSIIQGSQDLSPIFEIVYERNPGLRQEKLFSGNDRIGEVMKSVKLRELNSNTSGFHFKGCFCCISDEEELDFSDED